MTSPMKPSDRAALIARAKRAAVPVASCVTARLSPAHIIGGMSRAELSALVIVLAEAADHARLLAVAATGDDGLPAVRQAEPEDGDVDQRLRRAHTEAARLRRAGMAVPNHVRLLDNAYHEALKKAAREAAVVDPDPDAERNREVLAEALRERRAS